MNAKEAYCPLCGKRGLMLSRQVFGLSIVRCAECDAEMAIILEPEVEALEQPSTGTTH